MSGVEFWLVCGLIYVNICVIIDWVIGIKRNNALSKRLEELEYKVYRMNNRKVFKDSV